VYAKGDGWCNVRMMTRCSYDDECESMKCNNCSTPCARRQ
jgi:hypothetical protein